MGLKPTCKEVHQLVSESMDRRLTVAERVRRRLHLGVCDACTVFDQQMMLIRKAMRRMSSDPGDGSVPPSASEVALKPAAEQPPGQSREQDPKHKNGKEAE